jgi:hypothetical protein
MESELHSQANKLQELISAATASRPAAMGGLLFCSRPGLALVSAAFDLFECDGLYDIAHDVAREIDSDCHNGPSRRHHRDAG